MKMNTFNATGKVLDWLVTKALGAKTIKPERCFDCRYHEERGAGDDGDTQHYCHHKDMRESRSPWYRSEVRFSVYDTTPHDCPIGEFNPDPYSTDWSLGGPIVEQAWTDICAQNVRQMVTGNLKEAA